MAVVAVVAEGMLAHIPEVVADILEVVAHIPEAVAHTLLVDHSPADRIHLSVDSLGAESRNSADRSAD